MAATKTPYLVSTDPVRKMSGKGAPRDTIFGVLGKTTYDDKVRSLGGLVQNTKLSRVSKGTAMPERNAHQTEHSILGHASATHVPGQHMGQVPYAGYFRSTLGHALS
jgi:hypothetical protein